MNSTTNSDTDATDTGDGQLVYATRALVRALLEVAEDTEPTSITVQLATTPAADFADSTVENAPVFTHFYFPDAAPSNSAVFGMDLSVPPGRTHGLFVSHPTKGRSLSERDDLHERVFVAVPPWNVESVAVFDRSGRHHPLRLLDATVPPEGLP